MKAIALAGWLLADLALILFVAGVADTTVVTTTTTTKPVPITTTAPVTTVPPPTTTAPAGIDQPVSFLMSGVTPARFEGDARRVLGDEIEGRLREVGALDRRGAVILVFSKWGGTISESTVLSGMVNALLRERFPDLTAGAQLRDYGQAGTPGDVKIELFLLR